MESTAGAAAEGETMKSMNAGWATMSKEQQKAALSLLDRVDPELAQAARDGKAYACDIDTVLISNAADEASDD